MRKTRSASLTKGVNLNPVRWINIFERLISILTNKSKYRLIMVKVRNGLIIYIILAGGNIRILNQNKINR